MAMVASLAVAALFGLRPAAPELDFDADFVMVLTDPAQDPGPSLRDVQATFIHLRRDPMILKLAMADANAITRLPGPPAFAPMRAGPDAPDRLSLLRDPLFVSERQLITKLPSSRDDFALFQAQRSGAKEGRSAEGGDAQLSVDRGRTVTVADDSSWGNFISDDGDTDASVETGTAVYVETQIEDTTSVVLTLRESQRFALFEDVIVVLQTDRSLPDILQANGFDAARTTLIAQAADRLLALPALLPSESIVALRLRPDVGGKTLMQMSVYGPEGYIASLAQVGAGRFERSADPWISDNLLGRSDLQRVTAPPQLQDVRLLDALYSAAIRNGLPTKLVGEMIVIIAQRYDLDRFVAEGDRLTILFATDPVSDGLGQLLYVGIDGPSGKMDCYVTAAETAADYACFDFEATMAMAGTAGGSGRLASNFLVPVDGVRTSGFGPRHHPILKQVRNHDGVDWAAPIGTPVAAAADGVIAMVGDGQGYGNVVYIDHAGGVQSRYAHLNAFAPGLTKGATVQAGQIIGQVGTTGRSTGPHLHFELRVNGAAVDPMTFVGGTSQSAPGGAAVEALVDRIIRVESAGNATAKNPLSTATGLGQFIESTWLRMMQDYRPDLFTTMSRQQVLNLRTDPALSREMVTNLARENESFLRARGHQITAGRLYLAHFLGPGGANTALSASPEASVLDVMGGAVVGANPFLKGKTITDLRDWADRKMGQVGAGAVGTAPSTRRINVPPDVKQFRETVDQVLSGV